MDAKKHYQDGDNDLIEIINNFREIKDFRDYAIDGIEQIPRILNRAKTLDDFQRLYDEAIKWIKYVRMQVEEKCIPAEEFGAKLNNLEENIETQKATKELIELCKGAI